MQMTFEIVPISKDNKQLLSNVADDVFDHAIASQHLDAYLKQPSHKLIVGVIEGQVVGQVRGMIHYQPDEPPHLYVDNLGVAPEHQRQGIAKALFEALFKWANAHDCETYWVATEFDNDEGNQFYKALGLEPETMYFYEGKAHLPATS